MISSMELSSSGEMQNDNEQENDLGTKELAQDEKFMSMRVDESLVEQDIFELEAEDKNEHEKDSTCTIVRKFGQDEDSSPSSSRNNQILSITRLLDDSNLCADGVVSRVNVSVANAAAQDNNNQQEVYLVNFTADNNMYSGDRLDGLSSNNIQRNNQFEGFCQAKPKLSFASRKMKDYFESFKSHSGEKVRFYQFFKSIRTELVACLLFTLITSHALIVCQTRLYDNSETYRKWPSSGDKQSPIIDNKRDNEFEPQLSTIKFGSTRGATIHLVSGLVSALTVASLTQVFGHVSGCHLVPSISLALYVKGHISRARLTSYLFAQFVGSLFGVSLLGLLTTSQLTLEDYKELLNYRAQTGYMNSNSYSEASSNIGGLNFLKHEIQAEHHRKRREVDSDLKDDVIADVELNRDPYQASETILLSILEQQQRRKIDKRPNSVEGLVEHQIKMTNSSSSQVGILTNTTSSKFDDAPENSPPLKSYLPGSTAPSTKESGIDGLRRSDPIQIKASQVVTSDQAKSASSVRILKRTNKFSINDVDEVDNLTNNISKKRISGINLDLSPKLDECDQQKIKGIEQIETQTENKPVKLRRKKRNRHYQLNETANQRADTSQVEMNTANSDYYINLLGFSLPDAIMSGESIRQCIDSQSNKLQQQLSLETKKKVTRSQLADNSFYHCLSLSNSSQMFVFQLLATLIIVLTYLVNVDPRRADLGFRSLSIGFSYFVASAMAIQSGGFFGNPFHLMCLSWLSPTTSWQPEWFVYLITPLIGGLFGALSHEYIDFTSIRNCNKQLHLRRSFYSLENLQQTTSNNATGNQLASETHLSGVSTLSDLRRPRTVSSSSGSPESVEATSSVLNSPSGHQDPPAFRAAQIQSNTHRKFVSYSRQLRLEQRRAEAAHLKCPVKLANGFNPSNTIEFSSRGGGLKRSKASQLTRPEGSARRSQYEPNFLISSSPTERRFVSQTSVLM